MMNLVWAYKEKLPFFHKDVLWFSIPVTVFGFLCMIGSLIYQEYKNKKRI